MLIINMVSHIKTHSLTVPEKNQKLILVQSFSNFLIYIHLFMLALQKKNLVFTI